MFLIKAGMPCIWDNCPGSNELTREFYFLAGHLLKWHHLYPGIMPHNNSWMWSFFLEGLEWRQAWWQHGISEADRALDCMLARMGGGTTNASNN